MDRLYLLPNLLSATSSWEFNPPHIEALIAESEKGGRLFLKKFYKGKSLPIYLLNEHTQNVRQLLQLSHKEVGLISDSGLCSIADPGARLVYEARKQNITIHAYPGPSSIMQGLMLSGFPAQSFTFHGYLSRISTELKHQLRKMAPQTTHIFIEAPYRNDALLQALMTHLKESDLLCVAIDLMGEGERVQALPIKEWNRAFKIGKIPALFLIYKPSS